MQPLILIPARMASTRLPDKPLADIAGLPMIVQVWKRAVAADIGPVVVACDDVRIQDAVERAGGKAVLTKSDHPSGSDRIFEAMNLLGGDYDIIVNVQGDVPTIEPATIRAALTPLQNPAVDIATLACEIADEHERDDPSVVKPILEDIKNAVAHARDFTRMRQASTDGKFYHHIGIYAYRRAALERFVALPPSPRERTEKLEQLRAIEAGMRIDAAIVTAVPLGVDTPAQLDRARKLLGS